MSRKKSDLYFHTTSENLNCAQAVLKGFQQEFAITDNEIEEYRAWGGGRAEGGVCGALFAAECLLHQAGKQSVVEEFRKKAGGILCSEIKEKQFTCAEYVRMADELVEKKRK
jgi:hypothetical protein